MKRTIVGLGVALFGMLCARDASAGLMNPGVNCKYYGKQGSDSYLDPNGYAANGLKNTSSSSRYVVCALPTPTEPIDSVSIIMSTDADVCKVYQKNNASLSQTVHTRDWLWTFSGGTKLHEFQIGQEGFYLGRTTWSVYCNLPAGAVIRSFDIFTNPWD